MGRYFKKRDRTLMYIGDKIAEKVKIDIIDYNEKGYSEKNM